jgi:hypothetical protein
MFDMTFSITGPFNAGVDALLFAAAEHLQLLPSMWFIVNTVDPIWSWKDELIPEIERADGKSV